jgi:hypothetical protein
MKNKTLFIFLYGIVLALAITILSSLITPMVSKDNVRVAIAMTILISICLFLALFNYEPAKTPRQLELALIKRVKDSWLQALTDLEKSFHLTSPPEVVLSPPVSGTPRQREKLAEDSDKSTAKILEGFDGSRGSLLITGGPASGKTSGLLRLAKVLVERAENDPIEAIPVVLNLSNLGQRSDPLEHWIVRELKARYDVSEETARSWLLQGRLTLLLDGIDEDIYAGERLGQIKDFIKERPAARLVISGNNVPEHGMREVATLTRLPVHESTYTKNGEDFKSADAFVSEQLDRAKSLGLPYEPLQIKRWLRWLAGASSDKFQSQFTISQVQPSWLEPSWLRGIYLVTSRIAGAAIVMLLGTGLLYFAQALLRWVSQSSDAKISGVFGIEDNLGCWLLNTIFVGGIITAALDHYLGKQYSNEMNDSRSPLINFRDLVLYLAISSAAFFSFSFICINRAVPFLSADDVNFRKPFFGALVFGICFGLVFWVRSRERSLESDTNTAGKLVWSRAHLVAGLLRWGIPGGWIAGLVLAWSRTVDRLPRLDIVTGMFLLGIILGVIWILLWPRITKSTRVKTDMDGAVALNEILNARVLSGVLWLGVVFGLLSLFMIRMRYGPQFGFHLIILLSLMGAMVGAIVSGLRRVNIVEKTSPSQDIGMALRSTLLIWLSVSAPSVLFLWVFGGLIMRQSTAALGSGLFFGLGLGMLFGFAYAGFDVVYRCVFRLLLRINGAAPLMDWTAFLDYVANLGFLRKVGGGFVFDQVKLRNHFANLKQPQFAWEKLEQLISRRPTPGGREPATTQTEPAKNSEPGLSPPTKA